MANYGAIKKNDTANATGICVSIYFSGCDFHCQGCHNPETWDFNYGRPFTNETIAETLRALVANGVHRDLCILGGEPMHPRNVEAVMWLIQRVKKSLPDTKIYIWTGYTIEHLSKRADTETEEILRTADYIIDGPYIEAQRDITLQMRGSKNQRIWHRVKHLWVIYSEHDFEHPPCYNINNKQWFQWVPQNDECNENSRIPRIIEEQVTPLDTTHTQVVYPIAVFKKEESK